MMIVTEIGHLGARAEVDMIADDRVPHVRQVGESRVLSEIGIFAFDKGSNFRSGTDVGIASDIGMRPDYSIFPDIGIAFDICPRLEYGTFLDVDISINVHFSFNNCSSIGDRLIGANDGIRGFQEIPGISDRDPSAARAHYTISIFTHILSNEISDLELSARREWDIFEVIKYLIVELVDSDIGEVAIFGTFGLFYDTSSIARIITHEYPKILRILYGLAEGSIPLVLAELEDIIGLIQIISRYDDEVSLDLPI